MFETYPCYNTKHKIDTVFMSKSSHTFVIKTFKIRMALAFSDCLDLGLCSTKTFTAQ